MARRSRRNQFVGDLRAERPQEIEVPNEERQVGVIGDRVKRVYFHREMAPVLKNWRITGSGSLPSRSWVINAPL